MSERDAAELNSWRIFGAAVAPLVDRVLAAQGDAAEPETVALQHALNDLNRFNSPHSANAHADSI